MAAGVRLFITQDDANPRKKFTKFCFCLFFCILVTLFIYFSIDPFEDNDAGNSVSVKSYALSREFKRFNYTTNFNISGQDVIVFVHIQKTAGTTFEKFLVRYLEEKPCQCVNHKKRCSCKRPASNETWLFSRYSTGWICGLHADFTELYVNNCVENSLDKQSGTHKKRNYFYTTFLREPISRFISEFRHVQRGATWIQSKHVCKGKPASIDELPLCFDPRIGWDGVSLEEFIGCPYNLAFNRQTRMLADLTLVDCYKNIHALSEEEENVLLESAKRNLRKMSFFGIKERMDQSQMMFQNIFSLKFTKEMSNWNISKSGDTVLSEAQLEQIRNVNRLDIKLYEYALKLFDSRFTLL